MIRAALAVTLGLASMIYGQSREAIAWGQPHSGNNSGAGDIDYGQCEISTDETYQEIFSGVIWTVGLREDGSCTVWPGGYEYEGPYTHISIGFNHLIGTSPDGTIECFFDNQGPFTSCSLLSEDNVFVQTAAGSFRSSGLSQYDLALTEDGQIECFATALGGANQIFCLDEFPSNKFSYSQISASEEVALALTTDGKAWGWGRSLSPFFYPFPDDLIFTDVKAGNYHGLALDNNGFVHCNPGQFSDNGCDNTPTDQIFTQVAAGLEQNIGLTPDGAITSWGSEALLDGLGISNIPDGIFNQISIGWYHAAAISEDGKITSWGCGLNTTEVPSNTLFRSVVAGDRANICIREDGSSFCWGRDVLYYNPLTPDGFITAEICAGSGHFSLVSEFDGSVYCVGDEEDCDGVPSVKNFIQVDAGESHTVGLVEEGVIYCWGKNQFGQCDPPEDLLATSVASGYFHSMALSQDGHAVCWGSNGFGQCDSPDEVSFKQVAGGMFHSVGLTEGGSITCWGLNNFGQCDAPAGDGFIMVDAGKWHSIAIASDGTAHCWGRNDQGQCDIPEGIKFSSISAGGTHNIGLIDPIKSYCLTDLNNSGTTDLQDLIILLSDWGPCEELCAGDINSDGLTGYQDLLELISAWGPCSG